MYINITLSCAHIYLSEGLCAAGGGEVRLVPCPFLPLNILRHDSEKRTADF